MITKDVHELNVMKREGGGDIVIVDLGLFRMDPAFDSQEDSTGFEVWQENLSESRKYRIKILTNK